jgi:hypothetical protein
LIIFYIQVYGILDEMCIGGEIMETSKAIILGSLRNIESLE